MTIQTDYRCDEWNLILGAPGLIALVLLHTVPCSEVAAYQKLCAVSNAIAETDNQEVQSLLIKSVLDAVRAGQSSLWPTMHPRDLADVRSWALAACQQVAAVLAQKVPEAEAEAYTQWLMRIAQRVMLVPDGYGRDHDDLDVRYAQQCIALADLESIFYS